MERGAGSKQEGVRRRGKRLETGPSGGLAACEQHQDAVQIVVQEGSVIREAVEGEPWLYLAALYRAEVGLAQAVHRIGSATPHPLPHIDVEKALAWVEQRLSIQLAAAQQEAIRQACQHKMLVITGGPGVGKTTLVRSILEIFSAKDLKCVLAAPTGRAASGLRSCRTPRAWSAT